MEDRLLLSTYTVTNTLDTGPGSLRQAITDSNNTAGPNVIDFSIGSGVQTISPLSELPTISTPVTIDGTSQPGFSGSPLIVLAGTNAGPNANGLTINAGNSTVKSLVINRFHNGDGILIISSSGNLIQGNYIGTDVTGTQALGNGTGVDIEFEGSNNTVGGTTAATRNVISGNTSAGVYLAGGLVGRNFFISPASYNLIAGNYIGTDVTGTKALGNGTGVEVDGSNNTVGGTTAATRNVISGNTNDGIHIYSGNIASGNGNQIEGNYIGTDYSGTKALGNQTASGGTGVEIEGSNNTIGGTTAGAGNLISANNYFGIYVQSGSGNLIQGNYLGTDYTGSKALGTQDDGIRLDSGATNNTIGGTAANAGNTIGFFSYDGVLVNGGTGDTIRGNQIFSWSSNLSIELRNGGNDNQAAPVITAAVSTGSSTTISGTLTSAANTTYALDFFAFAWPNPTSQPLLGSSTVTTNASGYVSFTVTFSPAVPVGHYVRVTATAPNGDTSAFCPSFQVTGSAGPTGSFGPDGISGIVPVVLPEGAVSPGGLTVGSLMAELASTPVNVALAPAELDRVFQGLGTGEASPAPEAARLVTGRSDPSWDMSLGGDALSLSGSLPVAS